MQLGDWFRHGAVASPLGILFAFAYGLLTGAPMSAIGEGLWIAAAAGVAALTWYNIARTNCAARLGGDSDEEIKNRLKDLPAEVRQAISQGLSEIDAFQKPYEQLRKENQELRDRLERLGADTAGSVPPPFPANRLLRKVAAALSVQGTIAVKQPPTTTAEVTVTKPGEKK